MIYTKRSVYNEDIYGTLSLECKLMLMIGIG